MKTVFLQDRPAKTDSFGAHERIASSIAMMIENEEEGKAISLMGSWGSGKSTIINLLEEKFAYDKKTAIFTYDAWEHKKDPIRRSYIEEFHDFLLNELKVIDEKKFKYDLNRLRCNIEDKETTSEPRVTTLGKWAIFFLYFVPLGLLLLKAGLESSQHILIFPDINKFSLSFNTTSLNLGFFLLVWPFIFVGLCKLFGRDIFNVFTKQTTTTDKTNTIKTNDPTAIEFKEIYEKILAEAVRKQVKIIAVIDNLDRVNRDEVLDLWSTMQTLLDVGRNDPDISKSFWLLVPFDQSTPQRIWDCESCTETNEEGQVRCSPPCVGKRDQEGIGKRFVNKTFQVVIKVPQLRLTSWKEYFVGKMQIAFPDNSKSEHYDCFSLYEFFEVKRKPYIYSPTPREIIIFINRLGAVHNQWKDQIPLPVQALYVLCEDRIKIPEEDISPNLFNDDEEHVMRIVENVEWRKFFAALHFGVDVDSALSVLMSDQIKLTLEHGETDDIKKYENIVGLNDIFINVLSDLINNTNSFEVVINSIFVVDAYIFNDKSIEKRAWATLAYQYGNLIDFSSLSERPIECYDILLKQDNSGDYSFIVDIVAEHIADVTSATYDDSNAIFKILFKAIEVSKDNAVEIDFKKAMTFKDTSKYVSYLSLVIGRLDEEYEDYYMLNHEQKDKLDRYFSTIIAEDQFSEDLSKVYLFLYEHLELDPSVVFEAIENSEISLAEKAPVDISLLIKWSLSLANNHDCSVAQEYLISLVNSGFLFHLFAADYTNGPAFHPALLATVIYLSDTSSSYKSTDANVGLTQFVAFLNKPDHEWVNIEETYALSVEYNCVGLLTKKIDNEPFKKFIQYLISYIIDTHDEDVFTPEQFVSLSPQLSQIVSNYKSFSDDYISRNDIRSAVAQSAGFNTCSFYNMVFSQVADDDRCVDKIINYLNKLSAKQWKEHIDNNGICYKLVHKINKYKRNGFLTDTAVQYLKDMTEQTIETDIELITLKDIFFLNNLTHSSRIQFIFYVFHKFKSNNYNESLLKTLTPMFDSDPFVKRNIDSYTANVLTSLLFCQEYYGIGFVRARVDKDFAKNLSQSVKNRFYDSVVEAYGKQKGDRKSGIKSIGKKLGIQRLKKSKRKKK